MRLMPSYLHPVMNCRSHRSRCNIRIKFFSLFRFTTLGAAGHFVNCDVSRFRLFPVVSETSSRRHRSVLGIDQRLCADDVFDSDSPGILARFSSIEIQRREILPVPSSDWDYYHRDRCVVESTWIGTSDFHVEKRRCVEIFRSFHGAFAARNLCGIRLDSSLFICIFIQSSTIHVLVSKMFSCRSLYEKLLIYQLSGCLTKLNKSVAFKIVIIAFLKFVFTSSHPAL